MSAIALSASTDVSMLPIRQRDQARDFIYFYSFSMNVFVSAKCSEIVGF
jgi:hypothetical protein